MHIHLADEYQSGHSFVHRLDPRTKITIALLFILAVALTPFGAFPAYIALYLFLLLAVGGAGIKPLWIIKRSLIALPFALAAITLPFTVPGETLTTFGRLTISLEGTIRFISVLIKSWISVQAAILLVAVTPFPDLLWGLRALWVPQPLVTIVAFAYRYLFVMSDEALRLMRARTARSAVVPGRGKVAGRPGGGLLWRGKVTGRMVGSLMLRSLERSERIYQAMAARGYRGQLRALAPPQMQRSDWLVLIGATILLAAVVAITFLTG